MGLNKKYASNLNPILFFIFLLYNHNFHIIIHINELSDKIKKVLTHKILLAIGFFISKLINKKFEK